MRILTVLVSVVFILSTGGLTRAQHGQDDQSADAQLLADQLTEIYELVLDHHVAPPTMQQMVQESLALAFAAGTGRGMPPDLARELSETSGAANLRALMRRELEQIPYSNSANLAARLPRVLQSASVTVVPIKAQRVNEQIAANRYVGIGIAIGAFDGDFPRMAKVVPGGPADYVGSKDGDLIIEVDGKSTEGIKLEQVIDWLRGIEGSDVDIVLRHHGIDRDVTMTRAVVPLASLQPPIITKSGETAGIKLDRVTASTVHELREIEGTMDPNIKTVVLDFRRSGGGKNLHYGELLASALIDDDVIGWVADRNDKRRELRAEPGEIFFGRDLVVVIDGSTVGVLKWIAAALQDTGQGVVYGSEAAGPATTSESMELSCGTMSISIPVSTLCRADGEKLVARRSARNFTPLPNSRVRDEEKVAGVLYADHPFPRLSRLNAPNSPQFWALGQLIEMIEETSLANPPRVDG